MSVVLTPNTQLGFERPLTNLVKKVLLVKNNNTQPICFKVKTTSPRNYCVRPNSGRIEPNESVEVQVLLQPMREDPPPGTKCRDKFLVQSVLITPERDNASLAELWTLIEQEDKNLNDKALASIHEQKIRCIYLPAAEEALIPVEEESSRSSIIPPIRSTEENSSSTTVVPELTHPHSLQSSELPSPDSPSVLPAYTTPEPLIPSAEPPSSTRSSEDSVALRGQLKSAHDEMARLKSQLSAAEDTTLELRKRIASNESGTGVAHAQVTVDQKGKEGVPLAVVLVLVSGVFVLTWFFL